MVTLLAGMKTPQLVGLSPLSRCAKLKNNTCKSRVHEYN
jgi:hypothetical protein